MCLAIPGRIKSLDDPDTIPRMAEVEFGGILKKICVDFIPDIETGEYVMVHVGYAINKINEKEASDQMKVILEAEDIIRKKMR